MSANAAILAVIVGISPSIILAAVLVLVADQGRPKATALALGWTTALVVAGVSEIVRHDRAAATRDLAALAFIVIGSVGAFTPVVIAFLARDPQRVLHRWRVWIVAHWRTVVILIVGGAYLVAKGAIEWSHDRTTSSTPAAYRPRT